MMLRAGAGRPAADRGRSPPARRGAGRGDRPARRAERAAARRRARAGVDLHRRAGRADAADAAPPARRRARASDVRRRAEPPTAAGIGAYPRRRRSRPRATASACCASTTRSRSRGPSTTVDVLRELAAAIAARARARRARRGARDDSTVRLDLGFAAANIGSFDWDLRTNALHFDDRLMELFGYTAETFTPHIDSFTVRAAPRRPAAREAAIARADRPLRRLRGRLPRRPHDGTVRWVAARGRVLCDRTGAPGPDARRRLRHDRGPQRRPSALGRVLETMSTAFITLDLDWRFTYVNGAAERILGRRRDELVGRAICGRAIRSSAAPRPDAATAAR